MDSRIYPLPSPDSWGLPCTSDAPSRLRFEFESYLPAGLGCGGWNLFPGPARRLQRVTSCGHSSSNPPSLPARDTGAPSGSGRLSPGCAHSFSWRRERSSGARCVLQDVLTSRRAGSRHGSGRRAVHWVLPPGARGARLCGAGAAAVVAAAPRATRAAAAGRAGDGEDRTPHLSRARVRLQGRTVTTAALLARQCRGRFSRESGPAAGRNMRSCRGRARPR